MKISFYLQVQKKNWQTFKHTSTHIQSFEEKCTLIVTSLLMSLLLLLICLCLVLRSRFFRVFSLLNFRVKFWWCLLCFSSLSNDAEHELCELYHTNVRNYTRTHNAPIKPVQRPLCQNFFKTCVMQCCFVSPPPPPCYDTSTPSHSLTLTLTLTWNIASCNERCNSSKDTKDQPMIVENITTKSCVLHISC